MRIYLCYSSDDYLFAQQIISHLQSDQHEIIDALSTFGPKDNFEEKTTKAVSSADVIIVVLSDNLCRAAQYDPILNIVSQRIAPERQVTIVCTLDQCQAPEFLRGRGYVDFTTSFGEAFGRLRDALEKPSLLPILPITRFAVSLGKSAPTSKKMNATAGEGRPNNSDTKDVVVLIHGIRDFALWQSSVSETLRKSNFEVEPTNYGRFSAIKFLAPVPGFRRWAIREVWGQIRIVKKKYPNACLSIIAHSFGTYVVSQLIKRNFDLGAHRIVFCGSIVSYRFRFQDFEGRYTEILNDVGTRDVWPAIAESVTWGYGSAGTYGFRRPLVRDRWHNGAKHGNFLTAEFCEKYWVPFLKDGSIVPASAEPERPAPWVSFVTTFRIKYLAPILLILAYFSYPYVCAMGSFLLAKIFTS